MSGFQPLMAAAALIVFGQATAAPPTRMVSAPEPLILVTCDEVSGLDGSNDSTSVIVTPEPSIPLRNASSYPSPTSSFWRTIPTLACGLFCLRYDANTAPSVA